VSEFVVQVRQRARGNVTVPMLVWATVMSVAIFLFESRWSSASTATWVALIATALFGAYLGWQRRAAAVLVAPLVSWFFAWPLLWIAAMIHDGFVKGLFVGLFLVTVGWIGIGFTEFVGLGLVTLLVRTMRGTHGPGPDVVIIRPDVN